MQLPTEFSGGTFLTRVLFLGGLMAEGEQEKDYP